MINTNINRFEIFYKLNGSNNLGVELGVAEGTFSEVLILIISFNTIHMNMKKQRISYQNIKIIIF